MMTPHCILSAWVCSEAFVSDDKPADVVLCALATVRRSISCWYTLMHQRVSCPKGSLENCEQLLKFYVCCSWLQEQLHSGDKASVVTDLNITLALHNPTPAGST